MGRKKVGATKIDSNWERALALEPRLAELEQEILALPDPLPEDLDQSAVWSGSADRVGIKPRLMALVGWERGAGSPKAFDVAVKLCQTPEGRKVLSEHSENVPALSTDEEWLQSSAAYEAVTLHLSELIPPHWEALAS